MEDVKKLPKWAQDKIEQLEMRLKESIEREDIQAQKKKTRVSIPHFRMQGSEAKEFFLDDKDTFRFRFGPEHWNYIDVSLQKDRIQLMGGHGISIVPWATNVAKVGMTPE